MAGIAAFQRVSLMCQISTTDDFLELRKKHGCNDECICEHKKETVS